MKTSWILLVDAIVNLAVGCVLIFSPLGLGDKIGIPSVEDSFYPTILGAVLLGVGIALLLERSRRASAFVGLGLGGAIAINLCAGLTLVIYLVSGGLVMPLRGYIILWILAAVVLGVSLLELFASMRTETASAK
jgi:hypothetical protein